MSVAEAYFSREYNANWLNKMTIVYSKGSIFMKGVSEKREMLYI